MILFARFLLQVFVAFTPFIFLLSGCAIDNSLKGGWAEGSQNGESYSIQFKTNITGNSYTKKVNLELGETIEVTPIVLDSDGNIVANAEVSWTDSASELNVNSSSTPSNKRAVRMSSKGLHTLRAQFGGSSSEIELQSFADNELFPVFKVESSLPSFVFSSNQMYALQPISKGALYPTILFYSFANSTLTTFAPSQPKDLLPQNLGARLLGSYKVTDDGKFTVATIGFDNAELNRLSLYSINNESGVINEIYHIQPAETNPPQILQVTDEYIYFSPGLLSDGKLYRAPRDGSGGPVLLVDNLKNITFNKAVDKVFVTTAKDSPGNGYEPYVLDLNTLLFTQLNAVDFTHFSHSPSSIVLSPDEQNIIYESSVDSGSTKRELFAVDVDGTNHRRIYSPAVVGNNFNGFGFSPDSSKFYFLCNCGFGFYKLFIRPLDLSTTEVLISPADANAGFLQKLEFSSNSSRIYFSFKAYNTDYLDLYSNSTEGGDLVTLAKSTGYQDYVQSFSLNDDSTAIAYVVSSSDKNELTYYDFASSQKKVLSAKATSGEFFIENKHLFFKEMSILGASDLVNLKHYNVDTDTVKELAYNVSNIQYIPGVVKLGADKIYINSLSFRGIYDPNENLKTNISHRGSFFTISENKLQFAEQSNKLVLSQVDAHTGNQAIYSISPTGRDLTELNKQENSIGLIEELIVPKNSNRLFFRESMSSAFIGTIVGVNLDGTDSQEYFKTSDWSTGEGTPLSMKLTSDAKNLLAVLRAPASSYAVKHIDVETGTSTNIISGANNYSLAMSPDETYSVAYANSDLYLIKHNDLASPVTVPDAGVWRQIYFTPNSQTLLMLKFIGGKFELFSAAMTSPLVQTKLNQAIPAGRSVKNSILANDSIVLYQVNVVGPTQTDLFAVDLDGTNRATLSNVVAGGGISKFVANDDFSKIVYAGVIGASDRIQLYTVNRDGTGLTLVQQSIQYLANSYNDGIHWIKIDSQNSKAYIHSNITDLNSEEVYSFNLDGSLFQRVTPAMPVGARVIEATMNSDLTKIYFVSNMENLDNYSLYSINSDGLGLTKIHSEDLGDLDEIYDFILTKDEKYIFVTARLGDSTDLRIFRIRLNP